MAETAQRRQRTRPANGAGIHVSRAALEAGLEAVRQSPTEEGRLELIVRRPAENEREVVHTAELSIEMGLIGDCWPTYPRPDRPDGSPHPEAQITIMNARVAALVAGDLSRRPLAGDQLYVDLALSDEVLPSGTRLEIGSAVLEVTALPHRGCGKFLRRFGVDAMKFVNSDVGRELKLRGINARVVAGGSVREGDTVKRVAAPSRGSAVALTQAL